NAYLWDYNFTLPVAVINNARYEEVAYTSFEADSKGGFSFTGSPTSLNGAISGKNSYYLKDNSLTKESLNNSKKYILSYWATSPINVTGGSQVNRTNGKTIQGWTYYEKLIYNASNISLSGDGYIDDVRIYPEGAQMTTYTFELLKGISSISGLQDQIIYYEYDEFNRLKFIRDEYK